MKNKANFNNSEWTRKVDLKLYLRQNHLEGLFIHWDLPPELLIQDIWGGAQEFELRKKHSQVEPMLPIWGLLFENH